MLTLRTQAAKRKKYGCGNESKKEAEIEEAKRSVKSESQRARHGLRMSRPSVQ